MTRLLMVVGVLSAAMTMTPSIALADCDGPYPSFQESAQTARRIVIGEVVAAMPGPVEPMDGRTSRFTLRGWSVLEGDKPVEIVVSDLQSQQCAGYILARPGDRIAIAFEGHEFGQVVNAVAWLEGQPPDLFGIESTTVGSVYLLLGRVPPQLATAPTSVPVHAAGWPIVIGLALLAVLVAIIGFVMWRRRDSSPPR